MQVHPSVQQFFQSWTLKKWDLVEFVAALDLSAGMWHSDGWALLHTEGFVCLQRVKELEIWYFMRFRRHFPKMRISKEWICVETLLVSV